MNSIRTLALPLALLFIGTPMASAQGYLNFGQNSPPTVPAPAASAAGQVQHQPYYVDPSRFYYNQPSTLNGSQLRYPQPSYDYNNYGRRSYYRPNYNYYRCPRVSLYGYYGGPVYNYGNIPGATVHIGPFIPY